MAKIYLLESAQEPKVITTANGTMTRQALTLREIDGDSQYTQRYAVDYLGQGDLRPWQGHIVTTHITQRYSRNDRGDFINLQCREVISFGLPPRNLKS